MSVKDYLHPIKIGDVTVPGNVFLAPCAGFSDWPERLLCKRMGAALTVTEFVSIEGMIRDCPKTRDLLSFRPEELPLSAQIYGDIPEHVPDAAQLVEELGFSILDFNMGCPSKRVCRHGAGSALLKDPCRASAMIEQCVKAVTKIPVTVKMRTGFTYDTRNAIEVAKELVDIGVKMITVHGRTAAQGYSGFADWEFIARVKEAIPDVPIIGNGDIIGAASARRAFETSGVDGIMIGRGAIGNPWVFRDIVDGREDLEGMPPGYREDFHEVLDQHAIWMAERYGENKGAVLFRKHAVKYVRGTPGAGKLKEAICHSPSIQDMREILHTQRDWVKSLDRQDFVPITGPNSEEHSVEYGVTG